MKYLIALILLIATYKSEAQKPESFLIGNWKVTDVVLLKNAPPEAKKVLEMIKPDMLKTTLIFKEANRGTFKMPIGQITSERMPSSDTYWVYDPQKKYVVMSEWKDRKSKLAQFYVKTEGPLIYFIMDEYPVMLKIVKQDGD